MLFILKQSKKTKPTTVIEIVDQPTAEEPISTNLTTPTKELAAPEITSMETQGEPQVAISAQTTEATTAMEHDSAENPPIVSAELATSIAEPDAMAIINIEETVAIEGDAINPKTTMVEPLDGGSEAREREEEIKAQEGFSVKDSTTSAISDEEFSLMKKTNPLAAFKLLLSLSTSSTQLVSSSSTTSLNSVSQDSVEGLIRQLKTKISEGDFLAKLGDNPSEAYEVKDILQKLHKLQPSPELLTFLVEFGPLLETLSFNIKQRNEALKCKNKEATLQQEQLASFKASQTTINDIEAQVSKDEKDLGDWNSKIQRYNEEIKILQTKLANAEFQKGLVQERMKTPATQLEATAIEAIKHFDEAQAHQANITRLDKEIDYLETSIAVSTKIFDRLKATLQSFP